MNIETSLSIEELTLETRLQQIENSVYWLAKAAEMQIQHVKLISKELNKFRITTEKKLEEVEMSLGIGVIWNETNNESIDPQFEVLDDEGLE